LESKEGTDPLLPNSKNIHLVRLLKQALATGPQAKWGRAPFLAASLVKPAQSALAQARLMALMAAMSGAKRD
jgi:hypothetical protein